MNQKDRDGKNFLQCASELKQLELVRKLLNNPQPCTSTNDMEPHRKLSQTGSLRRADSQVTNSSKYHSLEITKAPSK